MKKGEEEVPIPLEDQKREHEKADSGDESASNGSEALRALTGSDVEDSAPKSISRSVFPADLDKLDRAISTLDEKAGALEAMHAEDVHTDSGSDIVQRQRGKKTEKRSTRSSCKQRAQLCRRVCWR